MATCPSCGKELPGEFPFCPFCAAPLTEQPTAAATAERKVVSVLFCDLVGFTASSEHADPEDIRRMLDAYFAMVREQIEAHGGVVEKFIGDAAVGVFGVPASHEDDPERAVRAGLRISEEAEKLTSLAGAPLRLRIGINTGEALVRLGVEPGSGAGFLAGDAVNTAARLQAAAPAMGVVAGLSTYKATTALFEYEELPTAAAKGKSEPVRVFVARATRGRLGADLIRADGSAYVGREIDLALLKGLFDKTVAASSVQLVTVVGEPGIGKSRIVAELLAYAQAAAPGLTWRQGRCLPYGDGVTFWALGEIVKAHAGILESDDPEAASAKLEQTVPDGPDRQWMRERLLPLVGVDVSSQAEREELFTAWRTFLETVAERTPTVLVFEDIHWADDAMLAFLEHLADRAQGVPLLVVGTARPELFERHASFAAGLHNVNRINLAPLSDEETARLVSSLLDTSEVPTELQQPIIDRSGGNPLYAGEFVHLLRDRGLLVQEEGSWRLRSGAEVPLPDSIQALIAARLDTLPADRKSMLADAAVVGKVFWAGAVAEMGRRDVGEVTEAMHELSHKELVRPARRSSMEGEAEYAFWHVLARDVAYAQLPRSSRSVRHVAAATWLEAKAGERVEDIAEVLAHHYATALELALAAGDTERATELEAPALRFLALAGERTLNLDVATAVAAFERALALAPPGNAARPELQMQMAEALDALNRVSEAVELVEQAIAAFDARGDDYRSARAMVRLAAKLSNMGQLEKPRELAGAALKRLEPLGPSEALVLALQEVSFLADHGDPRKTDYEDRALAMAEELGLAEQRIRVLAVRGLRRVNEGDEGGMDDMRRGLAAALEAGASSQAASLYDWLVFWLTISDGHAAANVQADEGIEFARRRGMRGWVNGIRGDRLAASFAAGAWSEVLSEAEDMIEESRAGGQFSTVFDASIYKVAVLSLRGQVEEAGELARGFLEHESGPLDPTFNFVVPRIRGLRSAGAEEAAIALLEEWVGPLEVEDCCSPYFRLRLTREAIALGRIDLARRYAAVHPISWAVQAPAETAALQAVIDEAEGRFDAALAAFRIAAQAWSGLQEPYETAMAELGAGRCLVQLGKGAEAESPLRAARERLATLGAAPVLEEIDSLLTRPAIRDGGTVGESQPAAS